MNTPTPLGNAIRRLELSKVWSVIRFSCLEQEQIILERAPCASPPALFAFLAELCFDRLKILEVLVALWRPIMGV